MATYIVLQLGILTLTLAMFFAIHKLRNKPLTKLRISNRTTIQSNRHLAQGSNLLARARSTSHQSQSLTLAKNALTEAESAISLTPKDASSHILKAFALDLLGHRNSALKSLDLALTSARVKSLTDKERVDALVKRAEWKSAVKRRRRVDSAIEDLVEAIRLSRDNTTALCLLGECYEWKGKREEAKEAFDWALRIEPNSLSASDGLQRYWAQSQVLSGPFGPS